MLLSGLPPDIRGSRHGRPLRSLPSGAGTGRRGKYQPHLSRRRPGGIERCGGQSFSPAHISAAGLEGSRGVVNTCSPVHITPAGLARSRGVVNASRTYQRRRPGEIEGSGEHRAIISVAVCPDGGIGRRDGFKIRCPKGRVGSSPTPGTSSSRHCRPRSASSALGSNLIHNLSPVGVKPHP